MAIRKQKEPNMANDDKSKDAGFIGRVVDDPANPPQARLLTGWLGDAAEAGYRRLYTDAELSSYVDLPEDAILHTEAIRDVQPSGSVFVWIRRDAAVKQGGSAASRAGRFLQGQVAQDFSSPEKAGFRCATQTPGCEPTGFTGQCTNQPDVGGAWPCITALPLCSAEPTGFTGKCTHQPWPNPTRYVGCTVLHCPTNDLTHQPHICRIVESGMPGCGGEPPKAEAAEGGEGEAAARPATSLPGCGYTETWGLCETQLLGCGFTKQWGPHCPPETNIPGCGWSKNPICTDLPGCGWTQQWGLCQPSVQNPCITVSETPDCAQVGARRAGPGTLTQGPCVTVECTIAGEPCITLSAGGACRTEFGPRCPQNTVRPPCPPTVTLLVCCDPPTPRRTIPNGDCTFFNCTNILCDTQLAKCQPSVQIPCITQDAACGVTRNPALCLAAAGGGGGMVGAPDTIVGPNCGQLRSVMAAQCPPTLIQPECFEVQTQVAVRCFDWRTVIQPQCLQLPTVPRCPEITAGCRWNAPDWRRAAGGGFFGAGADAAITGAACPPSVIDFCPSAIDACPTMKGCHTQPPTALCTPVPQYCPTYCGPDCQTPQPGCTSVNCTQAGPQCAQTNPPQCPDTTIGIACTAFPPHCPGDTNVQLDCTFGCTQFGTGCPATPAPHCAQTADPNCMQFGAAAAAGPIRPSPLLGCTQFGPQCPSRLIGCTQFGPQCPSRVIGCTQFSPQCPSRVIGCTQFGPQCPSRVIGCTQFGPQCPSRVIGCTQFGPRCPTRFGCTQIGALCPSAVDACPTRICGGGGMFGGAEAVGQTGWQGCTQYGQQCHTYPNGDCTFFGCGGGGQEGVGAAMGGPPIGPTGWFGCTRFGPQCPIGPTGWLGCTHFGPQCPTRQFECTMFCRTMPPQCPFPRENTFFPCTRIACFTVVGPRCNIPD